MSWRGCQIYCLRSSACVEDIQVALYSSFVSAILWQQQQQAHFASLSGSVEISASKICRYHILSYGLGLSDQIVPESVHFLDGSADKQKEIRTVD